MLQQWRENEKKKLWADLFSGCFICNLFSWLKLTASHWQTYTFLEEAIGDSNACQAARAATSKATGAKVSDIVLDGLPPKIKKQGLKGAIYQTEQGLFNDVADRTFRTLGVSSVGCVRLVFITVLKFGQFH